MDYPTREAATAKAEAVERRLTAKGFPVTSKKVWEIFGWHWAVEVGEYASVSGTGRGGYMCLISAGDHKGCGEIYWSPKDTGGRTPEVALLKSMKAVLIHANKIAPVVALCRRHVK